MTESTRVKMALISGIIMTSALLVFAFLVGSSLADYLISVSILVACIAIGWLTGTAISPDSTEEGEKFSQIGKTVSAFASGYLVSKTDKLVESVFKTETLLANPDPLPAFRLSTAFAVFLIVVAVTYTVRVYGRLPK